MTTATIERSRIVNGPLGLQMLRFGAPIALGMGLQTTFNLIDAFLISRLSVDVAGPALGALGICDQLSAVGTILSYGITTASTALIAHAHGKGDQAEVRKLVWQSTLAVGVLSILFGLIPILFADQILSDVVGAKGQVAELGAQYLRVNAGGGFSIFFLLQLTAIQRALGSSKTPVLLLILSNILNFLFAVLLVYGPGPAPEIFSFGPRIARALHIPRMELVGAAWATILARVLAIIPVVFVLVKRFKVFEWPLRPIEPDVLKRIWAIGWPSSVQFVVRMVSMLATHSLVARAFTTAQDQSATTALGIVFRLETAALFVAMGWGSAAQTFVGQNLGAEKPERAVESGIYAALYNLVLMLGIAIAYRYAAQPIVAFFDSDPKVIAIAVSYVFVVSWGYLGLGTGVVLGSSINGSGATKRTLASDLALVCGFQIPACVLSVILPGSTMDRLWAAVTCSYLLSGVVYWFVFRRSNWTGKLSAAV